MAGEPRNYIARLSDWADAHLTLLRNISTGLAIAGVILLAKSVKLPLRSDGKRPLLVPPVTETRLVGTREKPLLGPPNKQRNYVTLFTTKFTNPSEIPIEFIEKKVKLRGRVQRIHEQGLEVEHVPITLPIVSSLQRRWNSEGTLLVKIAGVELTKNGTIWLKEEVKPSQLIWFQLLTRTNSALNCLVIVNKGRFSSICLNEEILRQGFGRAVRIEGLAHESRLYWKLHRRLLQAELKAVKKNKGIWKEETFMEKLRTHISNNKSIQKLKQFATWLRIRL